MQHVQTDIGKIECRVSRQGPGIDVGPVPQQQLDEVNVANGAGDHERRVAVQVPRIHVGARQQHVAQRRNVVLRHRPAQSLVDLRCTRLL